MFMYCTLCSCSLHVQWEIQAIGQVGEGYAGQYHSMDAWILASMAPPETR